MHRSIAVLLEAFALSSAPNDEIEKSTKDLLNLLGEDLGESKSGYVEPTEVHKATTFLAQKIEEFNREIEEEVNDALQLTDEDLEEANNVEEEDDEQEDEEDDLDGEDINEPVINWDK